MTATVVDPASSAKEPEAGAETSAAVERKPLLQPGEFPGSQWIYYSGRKDTRLEETWSFVMEQGEPVLICRGEPHGYLRTTSFYSDFDLGLEWKFPNDEHGNSGVLMFATGEDRIWPTAVQVQLHEPKTGSVFGSGGAQVEPVLDTRNLMQPVNHWNTLQITCREGVVQVMINGKDVGNVKVVTPEAGSIGLQSEGSEVHFRNIWIRDIQPVARAADGGSSMSAVCPPCDSPRQRWTITNPPTFGVWDSYPNVNSWSWNEMPPWLVVPSSNARKARYVAHGNSLADGYYLFDSSRRAAVARTPAWERKDGSSRNSVRAPRGGRNRR